MLLYLRVRQQILAAGCSVTDACLSCACTTRTRTESAPPHGTAAHHIPPHITHRRRRSTDVPGPGTYLPLAKPAGPAYTIAGKPAGGAEPPGADTPGPGNYNVAGRETEGPAFTMGPRCVAKRGVCFPDLRPIKRSAGSLSVRRWLQPNRAAAAPLDYRACLLLGLSLAQST